MYSYYWTLRTVFVTSMPAKCKGILEATAVKLSSILGLTVDKVKQDAVYASGIT